MNGHPTPLEIMVALYEEIQRDDKEHPDNMIPVRIFRLIDRAFDRAREAHRARMAAENAD